ncbi:IclR family transcriptional regulator [Ralstonia soli]|uniref:IclR family transcriptional regulator n=1 Tax=Ralstonia soli TaxID=2953896 RepID=A0ABT1AFH1_9RALS|nr:IclR family transcriptional regulator [Ralstonia soli]MCO5397053.1 IclR family transcriptional regulator [Ralstonia soli]
MSTLPAHTDTDSDLDLESDADAELDTPARTGIQSIEVGFRLLEVLTHTNGPMMLRDLARAAPMNPAKAHRYLVSFARLGLVTQTPEGRYDLGPFALEMGLRSLNRQDPMRRARPTAAALRDEIDHTIGLAVWGNQGPAIVHWEEASHPVTVSLRLGDVMPMLNSATGRVFGAYLPRAQTLPFIQRELERAAARPDDNPELPRTLEAYDALCADVRHHGAARIHGGVLPGINAMSLPVFDANGQLCLVLIALGAQSTFDTTWSSPLERRLQQAAQQLSADLGYVAPTAPQP